MLRLLIGAIFMVAIFSGSKSARATDCPVCTKNYIQTAIATSDLKSAQELMDRNKKALATISENDASKRVKLASNILILTTKVETLTNTKEAADRTLFENKCNVCPKPRDEEIQKAMQEKKEG